MSNNSVLYVYDGFNNPGDAFSYCGTRHYVNAAGVACEHSVRLRDTRDLPSRLDLSGPDLVVFAGAPWLWEGCVRSEKYAAAYALLKSCAGAGKIAVGVGSCFLAAHTLPVLAAAVDRDRRELSEFWGLFDRVIVRDVLAWWILDRAGVKASLAVCPSVAVGEWYGRLKPAGGKAILSEPLESNFIYRYIPEADREFYSAACSRLRAGGAPEVEWVTRDRAALASRSVKSMSRAIEETGASEFFTARVHAALVAAGLGLKGELQALDSRSLSARLYGIKLVGPQAGAFEEIAEAAGRNAPPPEDTGRVLADGLKELV